MIFIFWYLPPAVRQVFPKYPPPMPHTRNFYSISIIISPFAIYEAQMTSSKVFSHHSPPSFLSPRSQNPFSFVYSQYFPSIKKHIGHSSVSYRLMQSLHRTTGTASIVGCFFKNATNSSLVGEISSHSNQKLIIVSSASISRIINKSLQQSNSNTIRTSSSAPPSGISRLSPSIVSL